MEPVNRRRRDRFLSLVRRPRTASASPAPSATSSLQRAHDLHVSPSASSSTEKNIRQPSFTGLTVKSVPRPTPEAPARSANDGTEISHQSNETSTSTPSGLWDTAINNLRHKIENRKLLIAFQSLVIDPSSKDEPTSADPSSDQDNFQDQQNILKGLSATARAASERASDTEWLQILQSRSKDAQSQMAVRSARLKPIANVLSMIEKAKDGITIAASVEPHAAMVWSCISFLLPLASGSLSQGEDAISGLEYISSLLTRYNLHEKTYLGSLPGGGPGSSSIPQSGLETELVANQFQKHTTTLYEKILLYQLSMACHYARTRLQRYARNVTMRDDWKGVLEEIKLHESRATFDMRAIDSDRIQSLVAGRDDDLRHKILSALSCDYESGKDSHPEAVPGTCDWFLHTSQYQQWMSGTIPLLLLTSGPGSGKSVLLRYLVDQFCLTSSTACCYYFFQNTGTGGHAVTRALSAVIHQLFLRSEGASASIVRKQWSDRGSSLTENLILLWQLLVDMASYGSGSVVVVIDALDEAKDDSRLKFMQLVNNYFRSTQSSTKLKMLISARPYYGTSFPLQLLSRGLKDSELDMDARDQDYEMLTIVQSEIAKLDLVESTKSHLLDQLLKKQTDSRTFLWLKVIFEYLAYATEFRHASIARIDLLISEAPNKLYDIYEKLLERSPDAGRARVLLHLLLAASEPLTLGQLQIGLWFEFSLAHPSLKWDAIKAMWQSEVDFRLTIGTLCGLFVNVVDQRVFLFHDTAREFLTARNLESPRPIGTWQQSFHPIISHLSLGSACTRFYRCSSLEDLLRFDKSANRIARNTFAEYAARNWLQHHALGSHTYYHSDYPALSAFEDAPTLILMDSPEPRMLDFAEAAFWAWFARSGPSAHQLQFEWASWLVLLIIGRGNANFDEETQRLLPLDVNDLAQCRVCLDLDCGRMLRFTRTDRDKFRRLFKKYCTIEYEEWRGDQRVEKKSDGTKRDPPPIPAASDPVASSRGIWPASSAGKRLDLASAKLDPPEDSAASFQSTTTWFKEENIVFFDYAIQDSYDDHKVDQTVSGTKEAAKTVYHWSQSTTSTPQAFLGAMLDQLCQHYVKARNSTVRLAGDSLLSISKGEVAADVNRYRGQYLNRIVFLDKLSALVLQHSLYQKIQSSTRGGIVSTVIPKDNSIDDRIIELALHMLSILRCDLDEMRIPSADEIWFPVDQEAIDRMRRRSDIDILALSIRDGLSDFLHDVRKHVCSVKWSLQAVQYLQELSQPREALEDPLFTAFADEVIKALYNAQSGPLDVVNTHLTAVSEKWYDSLKPLVAVEGETFLSREDFGRFNEFLMVSHIIEKEYARSRRPEKSPSRDLPGAIMSWRAERASRRLRSYIARYDKEERPVALARAVFDIWSEEVGASKQYEQDSLIRSQSQTFSRDGSPIEDL